MTRDHVMQPRLSQKLCQPIGKARMAWNEEPGGRLLPASWLPQSILQPLSGTVWPLSRALQPLPAHCSHTVDPLENNALVFQEATYCIEKTGGVFEVVHQIARACQPLH